MLAKGGWFIRSEIDPRWNCEGESLVGGFRMSSEAEEALEKKKKELGEAPSDLTHEYCKY